MKHRIEWLPVHPEGLVWRAFINGNEYLVIADGLPLPQAYTTAASRPRAALRSVAQLALEAEGLL